MPKQWYLWGPKTKGGKAQATNSSIAKSKPKSKAPAAMAAAGGCMAAVLQLFNSHHMQFRLHYTTSNCSQFDTPEDNNGLEAPRNSQEVEATPPLSSSSLSKTEQQPIELGRVDTKLPTVQVHSLKTEDPVVSSSESNTPTLVARLMGLDPLPTPSSLNRRLSLQVSRPKEVESVELRRHSCSERVKGREFGDDITNRTGERQGKGHRRDLQLLEPMKRNKPSQNCNSKRRLNQPSSGSVRKMECNVKSPSALSTRSPSYKFGKEKVRNKGSGGGQVGRRNTNTTVSISSSSRALKPRSINSDQPQAQAQLCGGGAGKDTRVGSTSRSPPPNHRPLSLRLKAPPRPPGFKGTSNATLLHHLLVGMDHFTGCAHEKTDIVAHIEREMIHTLLLDTLAALGLHHDFFC